MRLVDFGKYERSIRTYGGNAGRKIGVLDANHEPWMVKFPEPTKGMRGNVASYTTSPLSEWLGSHIYGLLGIPVHETSLGICEGKVVCGCKDFTYPDLRLHEFHEVKNSIPDEMAGYEERPSDGRSLYLGDVIAALSCLGGPYAAFDASTRFWDMFVVDGFIGNSDRNNGNWGFLSQSDDVIGLAPVYDNGNAFFNKRRDSTTEQRLLDDNLILQDAVGASLSCYLSRDGHRISPMRFIGEGQVQDCMQAVGRFLERLDLNALHDLIGSVPETALDAELLPESVKEFHLQVLTSRVREVMLPAYAQWVGKPGIGVELGLDDMARNARDAVEEEQSRAVGDGDQKPSQEAWDRFDGDKGDI